MDVLTAPETTTTRTSTRSRPRRWPSNADTAARRRALGHDDLRSPTAAQPTGTTSIDIEVEARAVRRRTHVLRRAHVTRLDRARLALVAAFFAAATAVAAVPEHDGAGPAATARPAAPAVTPTATTAPCSPITVNCCADAPGPVDVVRQLRPVCP
jgi:hypothetical protein